MKILYPRIQIDQEDEAESSAQIFAGAVERIIRHVFPPHFFEGENVLYFLHEKLPIVSWTTLKDPPFELSFFMWCRFRDNAYRFFCEMISRWLIPGKRLNALVQFAVDFSLPDLGPQKYICGEVRVRIESQKEMELLQQNLAIIETEIRLGLASYYQACRILEIKGLTSDEKTALIQENIVLLIKHRPQDFDYDILSEMQHFLVLCKEDFKQLRCWRHMSRIICVHYLFRKALQFSLEVYPERRYINVKLIRAVVNHKKVLGIAIGLSFLKDHERFEAQHILSGIQAILPTAHMVSGSFFCNQSRSNPTLTIYLEIEKEDEKTFSLEEERLLKETLASELKNRVEQRLNPIFMPQNEETIMRHILTLSSELKFVRDLPQAIIDFAQQTESDLEFLVVLLRVLKPKLQTLSMCFEKMPSFIEYLHDRTKLIDWPGKKLRKEASVFRLRLRKTPFLRKDHSVDLNRARSEVTKELSRIIGDFRDYNGGTISKENELFEQLRKSVGENAFLLENFFYSLNPPIMRSVLPADPLKKLFNMFLAGELEGLTADFPYQIRFQYDNCYLYILIVCRDFHFRDSVMLSLKPYSGRIATCTLLQTEFPSFGLIFRDPSEEDALRLRLTLEQTMAELYIDLQNKLKIV